MGHGAVCDDEFCGGKTTLAAVPAAAALPCGLLGLSSLGRFAPGAGGLFSLQSFGSFPLFVIGCLFP